MKRISDALRRHLRADFRWDLYGTVALFLALLIAFNYSVNLERGIIDSYRGNPLRIVWYFLLYCVAYYGGLFIWLGFTKEWERIKNPRFWLYSLSI